MRRKIINGLIAVLLLTICYYTGYALNGVYDNVFNMLDVMAISTGVSSVFWLFHKLG